MWKHLTEKLQFVTASESAPGNALAPLPPREVAPKGLAQEGLPAQPATGANEDADSKCREGGGGPVSDQAANVSDNSTSTVRIVEDSKLEQENLSAEQQTPRHGLAPALSVANVKISDVIRLSDVSVRLGNCITRASESGDLPVQTIGAYLVGLPHTQQQFLSIQNFGQQCAQELTSLIRKWEQAAAAACDPIDLGKRVGLLETDIEAQIKQFGITSCLCPDDSTSTVSADDQSHIEGRGLRIRICRIFDQVPFPECIFSGLVSVRLRHALADFERINGLECSSLALFLEKKDQWMARLAEQKNVGRKSREELLTILERIVSGLLTKAGLPPSDVTRLSVWLTRSEASSTSILLTDKQWEKLEGLREDCARFVREVAVDGNISEATKNVVREPETGMCDFLQGQLDERDFDVLNRRYGINRSRRQTLEEIAEGYGVTRERIRQIEAKAIKRCRLPSYYSVFQTFMEIQKDEILSAVVGGASIVSLDDAAGWHNVVTGLQRLAIKVLNDNFENWLDAHLEIVRLDDQRAAWIAPNISPAKRHQLEQWIRENAAGTSSLRRRIRDIMCSARWPVTISYLHENMPDVPEQRLLTCLRDEMGAEMKDGMISAIERLPSSTRVMLVLRDAGRPLHVSEVRARHNKLFGFDIEEHAAGAVLQRLEEALIVERGTYDLYENLNLDKDAIQTIRNASVSHLREKGHFLSAKILRRHLGEQLSPDINSHLTPYMLLGICQDDSRFAIRRGLMIGLAQEGFEETFTSLTDTIHGVVREHGPVSMVDIRGHISHQREVLDVSISMILQNSPEIVMPERGLYDVVEKVIGDDAQIERVSSAVQIALIDQKTSLPILMSRLAAVGYSYSPATIFSFLRNAGFVSRVGLVFHLTTPDPLVAAYNEKFHEIFDSLKDGSLNRAALTESLQNCDSQVLIPLDYRLVMNLVAWNNAQSSSGDDGDLLDELMSEFEF
jgi:RNA polymerase primary sigma factor